MSTKCRILKSGYCEITQYYGGNGNHLGTDIVGKNHTLDTVLAHTSGTVIYVQTGQSNNQGSTGNASYGNFVKIDHGNGWFTLYAHLNSVYVKNGAKVNKGQEIGYMGNTGNSYGAHTHFEVWKNNARTNPTEYLDKDLFSSVTTTVSRDENKDQLKVNVDDLRIRTNPGINQSIVGLAKLNGIYNYYETKNIDNYIWYKIADSQWLANKDKWLTIYTKKEVEDSKMIAELQKQIEELNKKIVDKDNKIKELESQLNNKEKDFDTFIAPQTDYYYFKLNEKETLKYKKDDKKM